MFEGVIGHENVKKIWKRSLDSSRVGHAYILTGPSGIGKHKLARALAASLIAKDDSQILQSIFESNCPDVMEVVPDGNNIKIENIREANRFLRIAPLISNKKVLIINDAHLMTTNAANSLLRILEEPPVNRHLFIITDRPHSLLATIRSRCQKLVCFPLSNENVIEVLLQLGWTKSDAENIVPYAEGSIERALKLEPEVINEAIKIFDNKNAPISVILGQAELWNNKARAEGAGDDFLLALGGICRKKWRESVANGNDALEFVNDWNAISTAFRWWETSANKQLLFENLLLKLENQDLGRA